jgi:hypothetical protein
VAEWTDYCTQNKIKLSEFQKNAAIKTKTPDYSIETPIVYNTDLDKITKDDEIRMIVIGDNPGKDEQLSKNQKYLCGQAGKLAEGFFKKNSELGVDFRKNVIILNKTPVHSAKTNQLLMMMKEGGEKVEKLIFESELWMAEKTAWLHKELNKTSSGVEKTSGENKSSEKQISSGVELWLVGYSELKKGGFFVPYKNRLREEYGDDGAWNKVFVFQHFSMNRFMIDLNEHKRGGNLKEEIHSLGNLHKKEIFE